MRENSNMALAREDREWIGQRARAAGFDLAGVASVPAPSTAELAEYERRYNEWIAAGHAGEMAYLKSEDGAGGFLRADLRRALPWARSVVVCAVNYNAAAPRSTDPAAPTSGWIARYAWSGHAGSPAGSDYHDVLLRKLRRLEAEIKARFGGPQPPAGSQPDRPAAAALQTRCYVDTGPLVERNYAERAGIGWIGKNTCVIHQQQGSWLLLGVIITSLECHEGAWSVAAADRCGTCTRCIDACPTAALIAPRQMDASRCIAYLTIEKKGSIPADLRAPMGRQVFGCDICQDVCPWNHKAPVASSGLLPARPELVNPSLAWLASLEGPEFTRVFRGSPVERTRRQTSRRKFFRRNVAIAMGNSGDAGFLPQLDAWAAKGGAVLAEAAAWAAQRIRNAARQVD
jgi:epoxyqueuosine reductase